MSSQPEQRSGPAVVVGVVVVPVLLMLLLAVVGRAFGAVGIGWVAATGVAGLILMVAAVVDLVKVVDERSAPWGSTELLWLIAIVLLGFVGPIVWLVSGRTQLVAANAEETEAPQP